MAGVFIKNLTDQKAKVWRNLPFAQVTKEILPDYEISLVFVRPKNARILNKQLRNKDYVPNVLSYVVGHKSAEILICPSEVAKQASAFCLLPSAYCLLLFIHGALHIKGWAHGVRMEKCERNILARFAKSCVSDYSNETTNSNRNRYRNLPGKDGSRGRAS